MAISMFGGIPNAQACKMRVCYQGTSVIYEGMPVCWAWDTTDNWLDVDKADYAAEVDSDTAEGYQNEGKVMYVEDPALDNLDFFAGVIAGRAKQGVTGTGSTIVDVYIANGAVVPVRTVLAATVVGRTILSIVSGTTTFGNPTTDVPNFGATAGSLNARPVAIAMETADAGIVLAKLCPDAFVHQGGQLSYELQVGYVGTVNTAVNRMFLVFAQTSGDQCALHYRSKLNGDGGYSKRGVYRFETFLTQDQGHNTYGLMAHLEIDADQTSGVAMSPFKISIRSRVTDPDLSSVTPLAAIHIDYILAAASGNPLSDAPHHGTILYVNTESGATQPDYFLISELLEGVGGVATAKAGTGTGSIKIRLNSIDYWLQYWDAAA